jgi:hypothetical protein
MRAEGYPRLFVVLLVRKEDPFLNCQVVYLPEPCCTIQKACFSFTCDLQ